MTITSATDTKLSPVPERHSAWSYIQSIFIILTVWQVIGSLPYFFLYINGMAENVYYNYLAISISFIAFIAAIIGCVKYIHRRNWLSLISPDHQVDFSRLAISFGLWFGWTALTTLVDALIHPGLYRVTFSLPGTIGFALMALVLTPIQTSAEEMFFRGYLLQGMQRVVRNRIVLMMLSGVIFAVPHFLNLEMSVNFALLALFYFTFGVFLAYMTLRDGRLEAALGIHAANNLFAMVFANYDGSSLPSPSVFTSAGMDPVYNLLVLALGVGIFIIFYRYFIRIRSEQQPQ